MRFLLLTFILVLSVSAPANAQQELCNGSLGDNIFQEGDFGSGQDVIFPHDPRIAPGYQYSWFTPLADGQYTLTNNIDHWIGNWPTWLHLQDNSPDSKGYMMVVNASYEPGVFYEQIVDDVCENTLYEFSADVVNLIKK